MTVKIKTCAFSGESKFNIHVIYLNCMLLFFFGYEIFVCRDLNHEHRYKLFLCSCLHVMSSLFNESKKNLKSHSQSMLPRFQLADA